MKQCHGICQKEKDESEFNKNQHLKDGLTSKCRDCLKTALAERTNRKKGKVDQMNDFNTRPV